MDIKFKAKPRYKFSDIEIGQTFSYDGNLYMKIIAIEFHGSVRTAVRLDSGDTYAFSLITPVDPVKGQFVEE